MQTFGRQIEELVDFMRLQFDLWGEALLFDLQMDTGTSEDLLKTAKVSDRCPPLTFTTLPWLEPTEVEAAAGAAGEAVEGPSGAWGSERERVGIREGVSHRRLSMASSCSIGQSAGSPSDSPTQEEGR